MTEFNQPSELAVVTGANGHIGSNLVRVLLANGISVRAVIRPGSPHPSLGGLPIEIVEQDIMNRDGWDGILAGCTLLFHTAALFTFHPQLKTKIIDTAVVGTRNVLEAASRCNTIKRIVYTSSTAAIGYSRNHDEIRNESNWNEAPADSYIEGKTLSERLAWQIAATNNLPLIVVNPSVVIGFHDYKITPSMQMVLHSLIRNMPFSIPGGLTVVDATDAALGHFLAAVKGIPGERYILGGERVTVREFYEIIGSLTGLPAPRYSLNQFLGKTLTGIMEYSAAIMRKRPLLTRDRFIDLYQRYGFYDNSKAINELGFTPHSARETIARGIAWLIIGNILPIGVFHRIILSEEVIKILPKGWKPGKVINFCTDLANNAQSN